MRSRNGSQTTLYRYCSLIFFLLFSSALLADEYYISYRVVVKNQKLFNESLFVSEAMKHCDGDALRESLRLERKKSENLDMILQNNKEAFIDFVGKVGLSISSDAAFDLRYMQTKTVVEMPTQCFKVDFNENFVKITPLK